LRGRGDHGAGSTARLVAVFPAAGWLVQARLQNAAGSGPGVEGDRARGMACPGQAFSMAVTAASAMRVTASTGSATVIVVVCSKV
jgi:hypothetical protein